MCLVLYSREMEMVPMPLLLLICFLLPLEPPCCCFAELNEQLCEIQGSLFLEVGARPTKVTWRSSQAILGCEIDGVAGKRVHEKR
jgi:hypothetical protein